MRNVTGGMLLLTLLLAGCGGEPSTAGAGGPTEVAYAPELGVSLEEMTLLPSGLYYRDLAEGQGEAAVPGNRVAVHYTGWLPDGTQFDSSRDRGQLFIFQLDAQEVIDGWDEGVSGMRPGGRRLLVIPPELGYGAAGAGGGAIPPGATLVFDVELVEIE